MALTDSASDGNACMYSSGVNQINDHKNKLLDKLHISKRLWETEKRQSRTKSKVRLHKKLRLFKAYGFCSIGAFKNRQHWNRQSTKIPWVVWKYDYKCCAGTFSERWMPLTWILQPRIPPNRREGWKACFPSEKRRGRSAGIAVARYAWQSYFQSIRLRKNAWFLLSYFTNYTLQQNWKCKEYVWCR